MGFYKTQRGKIEGIAEPRKPPIVDSEEEETEDQETQSKVPGNGQSHILVPSEENAPNGSDKSEN